MKNYIGITKSSGKSEAFIVQLPLRDRLYIGSRPDAESAARLYDAALFHLWPFRKKPLAPRRYNFGPYGSKSGHVVERSDEVAELVKFYRSDERRDANSAALCLDLTTRLNDFRQALDSVRREAVALSRALSTLTPESFPEGTDPVLACSKITRLDVATLSDSPLLGGELLTTIENFLYTHDGTPVSSI